MQAWGQAEASKAKYLKDVTNQIVIDLIVDNMVNTGFFSVWMTVFEDQPDMKLRFIRAISGTALSGCFDMTNGSAITPHPNSDLLQNGGKV